jgi:uncharacterized protein
MVDQSVHLSNWRAAHGGLLVALLAASAFVPQLAHWPWYFLGPLSAYAGLVCAIPSLRRSVAWLRPGRLDPAVLAVVGAIILVSSSTLVLFNVLMHPELGRLAEQLPIGTPMPLFVAGMLFATVNAFCEEVIFRGVLQDALESQVPIPAAVTVQAILFGLGHAQGYPPGFLGIALAALYGLILGIVRRWTGGLAAPIIAHIGADTTIFAIVVTTVPRAA